jgi:hypothetical protein
MCVLKKAGGVLFLLFFFILQAQGQPYKADYKAMALNRLLVELRQQYELQFSFDDRDLSNYSVSLSGTFESVDQLLNALFADLPLGWELMGKVYVIYQKEKNASPTQYLISGQVLEKGTGEPLPFSHVFIDDFQMVTDFKGAFSYVSLSDPLFQVKASHLGCFVADTLLHAGGTHKIYLTPFTYDLPEVVVRDNRVERSVQMGEAPGLISLNAYIAGYLPGNGDNAVFNLLRLQPGVVAAGEQPNDLIIWGSYEGTSRVTYDGFTIWGLKNFNDNISAVNPFMAKNLEVFKGGYDASHDDLVGGLVNITGEIGRRNKMGVNLFVNNQTVNGMVETPLSEKSSLVLAFRHTYYNLFEPDDVDLSSSRDLQYKIEVAPDYWFRDFNAKYSWQDDDGSLFYVSMLGADDDFAYTARQELQRNTIYQNTSEENHQLGGSIYRGKNLSTGDRYQVNAAWSGLFSTYAVERNIENQRFNPQFQGVDNITKTNVSEASLKFDYSFQRLPNHRPQAGMEWVQNNLAISEDSSNVENLNADYIGQRISGFFHDRIRFGNHIEVKPGIRINHSFYTSATYFDPRFEFQFRFGPGFKVNAAWGSYHQFLVKSALFDETGNFRYTWSLTDGEAIPVMGSQHWVAGATWERNDFTASIDGYYKSVEGFTRYVRYTQSHEEIFAGTGRSYGLDLFVKKDFDGNTLWTSYSIGRAEELFSYFPENDYRRAPHDQRHELKVAGLVRFLKHFHFSATYIYGSGFPLYANYLSEKYTEPDYSRLDLALVYRLSLPGITGEAGLSLLNTLDYNNVKYTSFEQIPLDQLYTAYIDAEAVTFTPLVFLKLEF